jgi:hypothetical protein
MTHGLSLEAPDLFWGDLVFLRESYLDSLREKGAAAQVDQLLAILRGSMAIGLPCYQVFVALNDRSKFFRHSVIVSVFPAGGKHKRA